MNYKSVDVDRYKNTTFDRNKSTPEEEFWNTFKVKSSVKKSAEYESHAAVNHVDFSQENDPIFAATTGSTVKLFDAKSGEFLRTLSKFKSTAYSGKLRKDGNMLAAGEESGRTKIFDVRRGTMLRDLKSHQAAVRSIVWMGTTQIVSCSDDGSACVWDVSSTSPLSKLKAHKDHVRASCILGDRLVTGSYDGTVMLWDVSKKRENVVTFNQGESVECVLGFQDYIVAASSNNIKVWDPRKNAEPLINRKQLHQRAISDIVCDNDYTRIITSSLEGFIGIHKLDIIKSEIATVARIAASSEVLSVAISSYTSYIGLGLLKGDIILKEREEDNQVVGEKKENFINYHEERFKDQTDEDAELKHRKKARNEHTSYDMALKKFEFRTALTEALKTRKPHVVVAVLQELDERGGIDAGLKNRNPEDLESLVSFLVKFLTNPKYSIILAPVVERLLHLYRSNNIVESNLIKLQKELQKEKLIQDDLQRLCGVMEAVLECPTKTN